MADLDDEIAATRSRLAELEARKAADAAVAAAPVPAPPTSSPPDHGGNVLAGAFAAVVVVLLVLGLISGNRNAAPAVSGGPTETQQEIAAAVADKPFVARPPPSPWTYTRDADEMTDKVTELACTYSNNKVHLEWPYGDVGAVLCIRRHPRHGTDVYLRLLDDGQILCTSYDGCRVRMRLDDAAPKTVSAVGASDNSSNVVFLRGATTAIAGLKASDVTRIELEFYQAGNQALEFPTAKLEWPMKPEPAKPTDAKTAG